MNDLKNKILTFLRNLPESQYDQFNKAFELYRELPNKVKALELQYNRIGYKEQSLKNLLYDLKKLAGITDVEILEVAAAEAPVLNLFFDRFIEVFGKLDEAIKSSALVLLKFVEEYGDDVILKTPVLAEYFQKDFGTFLSIVDEKEISENDFPRDLLIEHFEKEIKAVVFPEDLEKILAENKDVIQMNPADQNQDDFIADLNINKFVDLGADYKPQVLSSEESKSLREEFPFLNDPNCPELLFVVVGKRISAWKRYQALHTEIQDINAGKVESTPEDTAAITIDCERAFNENQQLWDELNHFGETGEILGKHPIFKQSVAKREVDGMTNEELFKFKNAAATFLSRKRKELAKNAENPEKLEQLNKEIADKEYMLSLVNAKIGVANGGTQIK